MSLEGLDFWYMVSRVSGRHDKVPEAFWWSLSKCQFVLWFEETRRVHERMSGSDCKHFSSQLSFGGENEPIPQRTLSPEEYTGPF